LVGPSHHVHLGLQLSVPAVRDGLHPLLPVLATSRLQHEPAAVRAAGAVQLECRARGPPLAAATARVGLGGGCRCGVTTGVSAHLSHGVEEVEVNTPARLGVVLGHVVEEHRDGLEHEEAPLPLGHVGPQLPEVPAPKRSSRDKRGIHPASSRRRHGCAFWLLLLATSTSLVVVAAPWSSRYRDHLLYRWLRREG
ncbi:unnamed protein product, partial [Ectocarpus sp. 13 AM-2016]